jgi:hypothetical protein
MEDDEASFITSFLDVLYESYFCYMSFILLVSQDRSSKYTVKWTDLE